MSPAVAAGAVRCSAHRYRTVPLVALAPAPVTFDLIVHTRLDEARLSEGDVLLGGQDVQSRRRRSSTRLRLRVCQPLTSPVATVSSMRRPYCSDVTAGLPPQQSGHL